MRHASLKQEKKEDEEEEREERKDEDGEGWEDKRRRKEEWPTYIMEDEYEIWTEGRGIESTYEKEEYMLGHLKSHLICNFWRKEDGVIKGERKIWIRDIHDQGAGGPGHPNPQPPHHPLFLMTFVILAVTPQSATTLRKATQGHLRKVAARKPQHAGSHMLCKHAPSHFIQKEPWTFHFSFLIPKDRILDVAGPIEKDIPSNLIKDGRWYIHAIEAFSIKKFFLA